MDKKTKIAQPIGVRPLLPPGYAAVLVVVLALMIGAIACNGLTLSPTLAHTATSAPSPTPEIQCVPWYAAPEHLGETTCVEGRILMMRPANAPRFAFMVFDPTFSIDDCCGKFHAWVRSEDWCEYFSDCRLGPQISTELNGVCVHVFGTVEKKMGRVHIAVNERSQLEIIDCAACQVPEACVPHQ